MSWRTRRHRRHRPDPPTRRSGGRVPWRPVREAARRALDDAQMDWGDIDAVVIGKAPDPSEGAMKPELYLTDALGAHGKPMFRVHTAGSVGGTTGIVASHRRDRSAPPRAGVGLPEAVGGNAQFALGPGKGAPRRRRRSPCSSAHYIHRSGAPPRRRPDGGGEGTGRTP